MDRTGTHSRRGRLVPQHREPETAVLPTARRYGMDVRSYSPLANGWLNGRARTENLRAPPAGAFADHGQAGTGSRWQPCCDPATLSGTAQPPAGGSWCIHPPAAGDPSVLGLPGRSQ